MVNLYPQIPSSQPQDEGGGRYHPGLDPLGEKDNRVDSFRLSNVSEALRFLENEQTKYSRCRRRYNTASNGVHTANLVISVMSAGCAIGGISLLATGVGILAGLATEGVSLATGLASFGLGCIEKRLHNKLHKHTALYTLAGAKFNSIKLIISKALIDNSISDSEFRQIQGDIAEYKMQKTEIQNKFRSEPINIEKMKSSFLEQGRQAGIQETLDRIRKLSSN